MAEFTDMWYFVFSYAVIFFGGFMLINFLSKGWLITYLRCKASRGALILTRVISLSDIYYRASKIENNFLVYKARDNKAKERTRFLVETGQIYDEAGAKMVTFNEITNNVIDVKGDTTPGHDVKHVDNLLVRALEKPTIGLTNNKMVIPIILILAVVGIGAYLFFTFSGVGQI